MKANLIGGGIGGLTAAIALNKVGIEAHVYERAPALREIGAGISLWTNAINALDELGLADAIRARGVSALQRGLRTWRGTALYAASYDELAERDRNPLVRWSARFWSSISHRKRRSVDGTSHYSWIVGNPYLIALRQSCPSSVNESAMMLRNYSTSQNPAAGRG